MKRIKYLIISVLVASMLMQFVPISNLGVKVYADETPEENSDEVEETEDIEQETGDPV